MSRERRLMRLLRALSGDTQDEAAEALGVSRSLIAAVENGAVEPDPAFLEPLADRAGISVADGDLLLRLYDTMLQAPRRWGLRPEEQLDRMAEDVRRQLEAAYRRLLTLPLPESLPRPEDRERAEELFHRLEPLTGEERSALVRADGQYRSWALGERACAASAAAAASRDLEAAAAWARLAREIAERARGPEPFRRRLQGYVAAHEANLPRAAGDLRAADAAFAEAEDVWRGGADPYPVLAPGLRELELSLRRDQRWPEEALDLVEKAWAEGHGPEHVLVKKGFSQQAMGDYAGAAETLRQALPLAEPAGDPRLLAMARFQLAVVETHLDRYKEARAQLQPLRELAAGLEDEIFASRVTWLEGRIAAGRRRRREAVLLLEEAGRELAARGRTYDAALARLEEAALLLEEGRGDEVKALAAELLRAFEAGGVHRETLAALRLFHQSAEQGQATAELARQVLRFLFRAQHDEGVRFEA